MSIVDRTTVFFKDNLKLDLTGAFSDNDFDSWTISVMKFDYETLDNPPVVSSIHHYKKDEYDYIFFDLDESDYEHNYNLDMYIVATDTNG